MKRSAPWRGMTLPLLCLVAAACGAAGDRAKSSDPNTPAVVKVAPPILPGDTATKREQPEPVVTNEVAEMTLSRNYALVGAGLSMSDPTLITAGYASDAKLTTPNGTFSGPSAILKEYQSFGMDGSVKDFNRQSHTLKIVDSTVVDSGTFMVARQRPGADATVEEGPYAAVWRIRPAPMEWVMTQDHLYRAKRKPPAKRK